MVYIFNLNSGFGLGGPDQIRTPQPPTIAPNQIKNKNTGPTSTFPPKCKLVETRGYGDWWPLRLLIHDALSFSISSILLLLPTGQSWFWWSNKLSCKYGQGVRNWPLCFMVESNWWRICLWDEMLVSVFIDQETF